MEKFSRITGQNIPQEPVKEITKEEKESLELKMGILALMDNFLSIRSYGTPRQELIEGNFKIDGREMFIEALIDLVKGESKKENIKVLESMRSETGDWYIIDKKIQELEEEIKFEKNGDTKIHKKNIRNFLKVYNDEKSFGLMLENYLGRIVDSDDAYRRGVVAKSMISSTNDLNTNKSLSNLSEGLFRRSKQLRKS